jgi:excinuclease ABC subunit A
MQNDRIEIRGASEHNLAGVNLDLPKKKYVVFTGVSGSGKTSLAFDTLFAEGNRRYVESLSTYARQFLGQMHRPAYETLRGLAPAISIQQKTFTHNPRSTVGTITEVYDYLRLLYARVGIQTCPRCGRALSSKSAQEMVEEILHLSLGTRFLILAPFPSEGLSHLPEGPMEVVVDRLVMKDDIFDRLCDSVELACRTGGGTVTVAPLDGEEMVFSEKVACLACELVFPSLTPASFSFNAPQGMCPRCQGLGTVREIDPDRIVPDPGMSIALGAVKLHKGSDRDGAKPYYQKALETFCRASAIPLDRPWKSLSARQRHLVLFGTSGEEKDWFEGAALLIERRLSQTRSAEMVRYYHRFFRENVCPECKGARLRPESLAVHLEGISLSSVTDMNVEQTLAFAIGLSFTGERAAVAKDIILEITSRLRFLSDVGVGYLTLARRGSTLSGGESQRIHLASQLGADLTGVLYILDEPSIGLHPADGDRLIGTLKSLRDGGNTVVVVEHDAAIIRAADHVVDFGPGAGIRGGRVVFQGTPKEMEASDLSLTGAYLSGRKAIPVPERRRRPSKKSLRLTRVRQNNLKNITVNLPLGLFVCVTGVSGAGKSSLVNQVLYPALHNRMGRRTRFLEGDCGHVKGLDHVRRVVQVDQRPIGKTPRSNPVIYTRAFNHVRDLFASLRDARAYGYDKSRFSFNLKGGRCEACRGDGLKRIEMHFLPDVFVPCDLCGGSRFNRATLKVRYKGFTVADILDLTVREALELFASHPKIVRPLEALADVGLDYVRLGQSSPTLSGGEAQRVKLARELSLAGPGDTVYLLDEPTTGLHFDDIRKLLAVLDRLVEAGNTVVVIEHNLEVVKCADHIIDLGPGGGAEGGHVVAKGTPEQVTACPDSITGRYLGDVLSRRILDDNAAPRTT